MYLKCGKFEHIIANYSITRYYIRKRFKENTRKTHRKDVYFGTENMDCAEALLRRRMFMKMFGIKGKRANLFAEKQFSEVHT